MSIHKYRAFVKAAEYGSFTRAAQLLGYTQSGISHILSDLETEWGISLLERDRSGVRLTSDGLMLLPFVKDVCDADDKLLSEIKELHGLRSGLIRVGTFSSVATHWLPNMIKTFQADYPDIEFELLLGDYTEIESWIIKGRVDFGFLRLPIKSDLETVYLEEDRLLVIIPENHPLAGCDRFPISGLSQDPFMILEKGAKNEISEIFDRHNITPDVRFTTWDDYAIMAMVENGLGISILPELILQRIPYKILTKELEVPASRQIGIAMKDAKTASIAVRRFLEYLRYRNKAESIRAGE